MVVVVVWVLWVLYFNCCGNDGNNVVDGVGGENVVGGRDIDNYEGDHHHPPSTPPFHTTHPHHPSTPPIHTTHPHHPSTPPIHATHACTHTQRGDGVFLQGWHVNHQLSQQAGHHGRSELTGWKEEV